MASKEWIGGASAVAQIETFTLNDDSVNGDVYTMTMTDENGGTATVSHTASGVDESVHAAAWQAKLVASTNTLFQAVTWEVASNVITGTAKVDGVPFYAASSVTGTGTVTDSESTSSAGPNDWNTAANWSTSGVPSSADAVTFSDSAYDVLYGLDQSSVDLDTLKIAEGYTGMIGQPSSGYYLMIDVSNTTGKMVCNGRGKAVMIDGLVDELVVISGIRSSDMLRVGPNSSIGVLRVLGPNVLGTVTISGAISLAKLYLIDCTRATVTTGENITDLNDVVVTGGILNNSSEVEGTTSSSDEVIELGRMLVTGGTVYQKAGKIRNLTITGGTYVHSGDGSIGLNSDADAFGLQQFGGAVRLDASKVKSITVVDAEIFSGTFSERSGTGVVSYTNDLISHAGNIQVDTATTIAVTR